MIAVDWLAALQAEAYALLGGDGAFVRRSAKEDCLFVSDLPRHADTAAVESAKLRLAESGLTARAQNGLLYVDATPPRFKALLTLLPNTPPKALPADDALHPAYALCRLWLHGPAAPLEEQPLGPLRRMLLSGDAPAELIRRVPRLYAQSAAWLRAHEPLPCAAGRVLSDWLQNR